MGCSSAQMGVCAQPHPLQSPGQRHSWLSLWFCLHKPGPQLHVLSAPPQPGPHPACGVRCHICSPVQAPHPWLWGDIHQTTDYGEQPPAPLRVCILERDTQSPEIWPSFHRKGITPFTGSRGHGGPWHLPISLGTSGCPVHERIAQPSTGQGPSGTVWLGGQRGIYWKPGRCRREWRRGEHGDESDGCVLQARARWWEDRQEFKWGHRSGGCRDVKPYEVYPVRYARASPSSHTCTSKAGRNKSRVPPVSVRSTDDPNPSPRPLHPLHPAPLSQCLQLKGMS